MSNETSPEVLQETNLSEQQMKSSQDPTNYSFSNFPLSDLIQCGATVRTSGVSSHSMEEVANNITRFLYDHFIDPKTGEREIILARLFKTHFYGELDNKLQKFARELVGVDEVDDEVKCLTLLGSTGDLPEWNTRNNSGGHQAIPLLSEQSVSGIPMIAQLISQFGLQIGTILRPDPKLLIELDKQTYNIFHVPVADGSPYIPAQAEFVQKYGVRSVLGFGGMLPTGNLFSVILFAKSSIPRTIAEVFQTVALNTKIAILPFEDKLVFSERVEKRPETVDENNEQAHPESYLRQYRSKIAAFDELGKVYDQTVIEQSNHLRQTMLKLEQSNADLVEEISTRKQVELEREKLHEQLIATSRKAGMSEIATGILHNVGNVLNSVNVSVNTLIDDTKNSHILGFTKAVGLMNEHANDLGEYITTDQRGKLLPEYLTGLAHEMTEERDNTSEELTGLLKHIQHINQVIAMQQSHATLSGLTEQFDLSELVSSALDLNDSSFHRHSIKVQREYEKLPKINSDKNKILQILVNLISNAKHALDALDTVEKTIVLRVAASRSNYVVFEVEDNGVGIEKDNLEKIFSFGFTTKKDGHGFGLHSCALAAMELGGTLEAHSDGAGQGAKFTLELPVDQSVIESATD